MCEPHLSVRLGGRDGLVLDVAPEVDRRVGGANDWPGKSREGALASAPRLDPFVSLRPCQIESGFRIGVARPVVPVEDRC